MELFKWFPRLDQFRLYDKGRTVAIDKAHEIIPSIVKCKLQCEYAEILISLISDIHNFILSVNTLKY